MASHLAQILSQTLNADPNARIQAELTLAEALNDPRACHNASATRSLIL